MFIPLPFLSTSNYLVLILHLQSTLVKLAYPIYRMKCGGKVIEIWPILPFFFFFFFWGGGGGGNLL